MCILNLGQISFLNWLRTLSDTFWLTWPTVNCWPLKVTSMCVVDWDDDTCCGQVPRRPDRKVKLKRGWVNDHGLSCGGQKTAKRLTLAKMPAEALPVRILRPSLDGILEGNLDLPVWSVSVLVSPPTYCHGLFPLSLITACLLNVFARLLMCENLTINCLKTSNWTPSHYNAPQTPIRVSRTRLIWTWRDSFSTREGSVSCSSLCHSAWKVIGI